MKRFIFITFVLIMIAVNAKILALNWQSLNATQVDKKEEGSHTILTLRDQEKRIFKITYQDETNAEKLAEKIIALKNEFYAWQNIHFKNISFVVSASFLEIVIIPHEVINNGQNLVSAIPAGIAMTYYPENAALYYDFRIMKDNLLIRIAGDYLNEKELLSKLCFAYENPMAYLQRTGPEKLPEKKPAGDQGEIQNVLDNLVNENAKLKNDLKELKEGLDTLKKENENLRQLLVYFHNLDSFNRLRQIPAETIKEVVELKRGNPGMSRGQLSKELKKKKITLSKKELDLILIIYFHEFSQTPDSNRNPN